MGSNQMLLLCGLGYWVQGFRCFPWLALNFHMAHYLNLHPSLLQLVQNSGNLPMVAKPLYGILSDALYIGGARRVPYISIGGMLSFSLDLNYVLVFLVCSFFLSFLSRASFLTLALFIRFFARISSCIRFLSAFGLMNDVIIT